MKRREMQDENYMYVQEKLGNDELLLSILSARSLTSLGERSIDTILLKGLPCSCINNMAKGSKKQQQPVSAKFLNDFVEFTTGDIQKTRKGPCCLSFGKTDDTASPAFPRVRRSLLQPHPWTPCIYSTLGFSNVRVCLMRPMGNSLLTFRVMSI